MNTKLIIIGVGIIITLLLLFLPFLLWNGSQTNNTITNLVYGVEELYTRKNYLSSIICMIVGILPFIFSVIFANRHNLNKASILITSIIILIFIVLGIYHIHRHHMISNYGKVTWLLSWGYYVYLVSMIGISILSSKLILDSLRKKNS